MRERVVIGPGALWRGGTTADAFKERELEDFDGEGLRRHFGRLISEAKTVDEQNAFRAELERRLKAIN